MQEQHRVGLVDLAPGAFDADLFHFVHVRAVAQTRGVDHVQRHTLDLNRLLHHIARGAGHRGHDRQLGTGQRVEQRAFARVGLPGDHHREPVTQQCALPGLGPHVGQRGAQALQLTRGVGLLQKVDLLFREIQRRLDQHAQVDEHVAQRMDALGEHPSERAAGAARRGFGAGVDQVGHRLSLG
ncbi:hypothetical protein D9M69_518440 [compost metagenome]